MAGLVEVKSFIADHLFVVHLILIICVARGQESLVSVVATLGSILDFQLGQNLASSSLQDGATK